MSTVLSDLYTNLALSSCGWLLLWLHHKIGGKKKNPASNGHNASPGVTLVV